MTTATAQSKLIQLGTYATEEGERELVATGHSGAWALVDQTVEAGYEDGDRDERWVEDHIDCWLEVEAIAIEYLAQADYERAPLMRP